MRPRGQVQVRRSDRTRVAEQVGERRLRRRAEIVLREFVSPLGRVVDRPLSRHRLDEAGGLVADEHVRVLLDDLRQEGRNRAVRNPRECVEDLEAEVLRSLLVRLQ